MKKLLSKIDIASLILAIVLIYMVFFDSKPIVNTDDILIEKIKQVNKERLKELSKDSIKYSLKIDSLNNVVTQVKKKRKYEHDKYIQEQSKYNNLTTDSSYFAVLDSIKKVCCSDSTSR